MTNAQYESEQLLRKITVSSALSRYADTVTPRKKDEGAKEKQRIAFLKRSMLAPLLLKDVTPSKVEEWRKEREHEVSSGTVRREWTMFEHMYNVARTQWGLPVKNPVFRVRYASSCTTA